MIWYILKRLIAAVPTLIAVLTVVFLIVRVIPGDPAMTVLGDQATPAALEALRAKLGTDRPLYVQYWEFLWAALQGDLGRSLVSGRPIVAEVAAVLPHTIDLTLASLVVGAAIGIPLGIWAALHRNRFIDYAARIGSLIGLSFPVFVSGIFLLLAFALHWRWFPVIGSANLADPGDRLWKLVLPTANLGLIMAAYITRVTRSAMLQVLSEDYVRTARAKGVSEWLVICRHALKNAALPVVTVTGLQFGLLLGGAVITETVFAVPGVGRLIVGAIRQLDFPVVQAGVFMLAMIVVSVNFLVDLLYGYLNPQIRIR
jgi:ABC-type dipeptide/oligopeptide/nickel transport system permease component